MRWMVLKPAFNQSRHPKSISSSSDPAKVLITVTDNGAGLNDANFKSFRTPFSGMKLNKKGRGFGRFIAFKVFSKIVYRSRYQFMGEPGARAFRFNIHEQKELNFDEGGAVDFQGPGLQVEYSQPLTDWSDLIRDLKSKDVLEEIGGHFLPYFLYRWLPTITVQFDDEAPHDITSTFSTVFVQYDSGEFECEIDGSVEKLQYSLTRVTLRGGQVQEP
jgi:hypothetical protein